MSDVTQIIPNTIDQLIKQCILLETELKKVTDERDKLLLEKTTAKTPKIPVDIKQGKNQLTK